ncbi:hypothetical protein MKZ38_009161 [Zalerion maritima]|uniref:Uncharacterized protein n=1 Tax=Zalerion maritima TaxID=339359 RepID=A0AAD5RGQ6_9PEZI|nr:hypothetical protein MKZ38_009161 [Zalerion maritima]
MLSADKPTLSLPTPSTVPPHTSGLKLAHLVGLNLVRRHKYHLEFSLWTSAVDFIFSSGSLKILLFSTQKKSASMATYIPPHVRALRDSATDTAGEAKLPSNETTETVESSSSPTEDATRTVQRPYHGETMEGVDIRSIFKHFSPDVEYDRETVHTLNSSQHCPDGIKFVILYPGAHPRWRDYILFSKTAVSLLPAYHEEKAKFEHAKKEFEGKMAEGKVDEKHERTTEYLTSLKLEEPKVEDIVEVEEYGGQYVETQATDAAKSPSPSISTPETNITQEDYKVGNIKQENGDVIRSDKEIKDSEEDEDNSTATSIRPQNKEVGEPDKTPVVENRKCSKEYTDVRFENPESQQSSKIPEKADAQGRKNTSAKMTDKFDAIDYNPPVHTPIAFFRAFDGNGRSCTFVGWYQIDKICLLPPQSPRIKDLLQDKWGKTVQQTRKGGRWGRGGRGGRGWEKGRGGPLRNRAAWERDMNTEWAVLRFTKLKPGSGECPLEPDVQLWAEERWEGSSKSETKALEDIACVKSDSEIRDEGKKKEIPHTVVDEVFKQRKLEEN